MGNRILHLAQFVGIGGLEKILYLLIKEQIIAGNHVELIVYDIEQTWVNYFRSEGIIVHSDFRKNQGYDLNLLRWLDQKIINFDIVHTHDLNPLMYAAPLKLWRLLRDHPFPRLIHTAHGTEHTLRRPITRLYEKLCSLQTYKTIGVSEMIRDFYVKDLLLRPEKVVAINNGTSLPLGEIDHEKARERLIKTFHLRPHCRIWTNVARIVPLKQQHLLIEAAKQRPEIELLLIGPSGDGPYWNEIFKDLPPNVHMPGGRSDISEILDGSDYFVSASSHEGIPVAALEAGARGLPCLLSSIPGHLTLQKSSPVKVAEYFGPSELTGLILGMRRLEENETPTSEMALNLFNHVRANFSSARMWQDYRKVYEGVE